MTEQEMNVAIAVASGWIWDQPFNKRRAKNILISPDGRKACYVWCDGQLGGNIPDYCTDLNAMYDAEATLTPLQRGRYTCELGGCVQEPDDDDWWKVANATARQRAEAFLRTFGKWVEA